MFTQEMTKAMIGSKLKIALATKNHEDIRKFIEKSKKLEAELKRIV